ncbi:hypothetical protein HK097_000832, partial [Rhizophlyctis rosea]
MLRRSLRLIAPACRVNAVGKPSLFRPLASPRLSPLSRTTSLRWASTVDPSSQSLAGSAKIDGVEERRLPKRPTTKKKKVFQRDLSEEGIDLNGHSHELLKATAYCTAEKYDFDALLPLLRKHYILLPYIAEDVYQVHLTDPQTINSPTWEGSSPSSPPQPEAFIFPTGSFVTWGATIGQSERLLRLLKKAEVNPGKITTEEFMYYEDQEHAGGLAGDTIILGQSLPPREAKLAYSAGLARSAKLESLESHLDSHLEKNRNIPQFLLQGKKLPLGREEVLRNLGELFLLRGHLNLHSEMLDLPEFCWSSSKMEEAFEKVSRNLDVRTRIAIFNKKLDYANELAEVLRNHLHEQHSLGLEWCIIILISVEICFEFVHWMDKVGMIDVEGAYRALMRKGPKSLGSGGVEGKGGEPTLVEEFVSDEPGWI